MNSLIAQVCDCSSQILIKKNNSKNRCHVMDVTTHSVKAGEFCTIKLKTTHHEN